MMNLHAEAKEIAQEALAECGHDMDRLQQYIHEACDGHRVSIMYHEGIKFCAEQDASLRIGEEWLDDCGGIAQKGDSFGAIACRIAFATLLCACCDALDEIMEG